VTGDAKNTGLAWILLPKVYLCKSMWIDPGRELRTAESASDVTPEFAVRERVGMRFSGR